MNGLHTLTALSGVVAILASGAAGSGNDEIRDEDGQVVLRLQFQVLF